MYFYCMYLCGGKVCRGVDTLMEVPRYLKGQGCRHPHQTVDCFCLLFLCRLIYLLRHIALFVLRLANVLVYKHVYCVHVCACVDVLCVLSSVAFCVC